MKDYIITIDCGTTNTRAILWHGEEIVSVEKSETGVRNTAIDGNNSRLKQAVKGCIDALCEKNNLSFEDIKRVLASGMITSNVGLVEIPHLVVPVGLEELARGIQAVELEDVCPLAINFIPGVKNYGGELSIDGDFETMDIMRGEEVETMAVLQKYPAGKSYLLVLPGSHTKFVSTNEKGQITGCLTTIAGELLSAITRDTIIADAVGRQFVANEDYDKKWLLKGFDTAERVGLGRACFSGRILSMFAEKDKKKIANFILGASLQIDIAAARNSGAIKIDRDTTVIVSGKDPLRRAIYDILEHIEYFSDIKTFTPDEKEPLSGVGARLVAEKSHIF